MRLWRRILAAWVALLALGYIVPRYAWLRQRMLPGDVEYLHGPSGNQLAMVHIRRGHPNLVVVVHGLLKRMDNAQIAALVGALAEDLDVLVFDLPGHGQSQGETDLRYSSVAGAVSEVLGYATTLRYAHTGVVGYSMGAAASIMAVAGGAPADALVSVSCPTSPVIERGVGAYLNYWPLRAWLRLMGTRVASRVQAGAGPLDYVCRVAPVPLLVVHGGLDTLVRRAESEALYAAARPPKDWLYVPGAPHAWPMASAREAIAWLKRQMPDEGEE